MNTELLAHLKAMSIRCHAPVASPSLSAEIGKAFEDAIEEIKLQSAESNARDELLRDAFPHVTGSIKDRIADLGIIEFENEVVSTQQCVHVWSRDVRPLSNKPNQCTLCGKPAP